MAENFAQLRHILTPIAEARQCRNPLRITEIYGGKQLRHILRDGNSGNTLRSGKTHHRIIYYDNNNAHGKLSHHFTGTVSHCHENGTRTPDRPGEAKYPVLLRSEIPNTDKSGNRVADPRSNCRSRKPPFKYEKSNIVQNDVHDPADERRKQRKPRLPRRNEEDIKNKACHGERSRQKKRARICRTKRVKHVIRTEAV